MSAEADWKVQAEYPGFWARVYASALDTLFLILPLSFIGEWVLNVLLGTERFEERLAFQQQYLEQAQSLDHFARDFYASGLAATMGTEVLLSCLLFIAPVIYCWAKYSVTPGKYFARMRIVDADTGRKISLKQSLLRYLGYFVSTVVFLLGFFWIAFDKRRQGWHDKIAGTVVVYVSTLPKETGQHHV